MSKWFKLSRYLLVKENFKHAHKYHVNYINNNNHKNNGILNHLAVAICPQKGRLTASYLSAKKTNIF